MQGVGAIAPRLEPSPRFIPSPGLAPIAGPGAGLAAPVLIPPFPPGGVPFGPAAAAAGAFGVGLLIGDAINIALDRPTLFNWGLLNPPTPEIPPGDPLSPGVSVNLTGSMGTEGAWVTANASYGTSRRIGENGECQPAGGGANQGARTRVRAGGGQLQYREEGPGECTPLAGAAVYVVEIPAQDGNEARLKSLNGLSSGNFRPSGSFTTVDFDIDFEPVGDPLDFIPDPLWVPQPLPEVTPDPEVEPQPEQDPDEQRPLAPPIAPPSPPPIPNAPPITPPVPNPNPRPVPGPFPDPSPATPPAPLPTPTPVPSPSPGPGKAPVPDNANPLGLDGNPGPTRAGDVIITDKFARYPVSQGPNVTTPGPAPTLPGIAMEVGRIENKLDRMLRRDNDIDFGDLARLLLLVPFIEDLLGLIFRDGPGGAFTVNESCSGKDYGEEGPPKYTVTYPGSTDYLTELQSQVEAVARLMQGNFELKVNTCKSRHTPEGDWVTVRFVSDENSPNNNRPLRKLFRYRDNSGTGADEHSRHWADFTWQAGPYCVIHKGAKWGTPQVWASSVAEGQRVINFAASIAGIDTDQDGEWSTSFSSNPRYGQPGTMRVQRVWGFPAVSKRDGSDGPPTLYI